MKFLPLQGANIVTNALNFSTPEVHVIGACDVYTTKAAGSDKKLYKSIEDRLESQYASLVRLSASLSPPAAQQPSSSILASKNSRRKGSRTAELPVLDLSRDSPFGSLSELSARRTFAYLIATLNAAYPDYDFSNVLRPKDFKRETSKQEVKNFIDGYLMNLRPQKHYYTQSFSDQSALLANNDVWSNRMWDILDDELDFSQCAAYSYKPREDPFDDEKCALWSMHYFFFNQEKKRVCYFHVRALSVISHSPAWKQPILKYRSGHGAGKRANYWLGDLATDAIDPDLIIEEYPESSDDEDVDRIRYTDLDQIRNDIDYGNGRWGMDSVDDYGDDLVDDKHKGPGSVTDEIGDAMEIDV